MIISAEKKAEFLQEVLTIQQHLTNSGGDKLTSQIIESNKTFPFPLVIENETAEQREEREDQLIAKIFNYNQKLSHLVPNITSPKDKVDLERFCRERMSRKELKDKLRTKKFSKVDKWIHLPSVNNILERYLCDTRTIITISTLYSYEGDIFDVRSFITINTVTGIEISALNDLISGLAF